MIYIKNARIVDPVTGMDEIGDVALVDNFVAGAGKDLDIEDIKARYDVDGNDIQTIDATGLVVAPGLVDTHVHFRDPGFTYKEDIDTGAAAAARGGFTTVVCMANTKPVVDNVETLKYIQEKGEKTPIHVLQTATVTKGMAGKELVDMEALEEAGAAGFTDDGLPIMDEEVLVEALNKASELDLPVSLHEEDPLFVKQRCKYGSGIREAWIWRSFPYSRGCNGCKRCGAGAWNWSDTMYTAYKFKE